jgi:hypothetical protein
MYTPIFIKLAKKQQKAYFHTLPSILTSFVFYALDRIIWRLTRSYLRRRKPFGA